MALFTRSDGGFLEVYLTDATAGLGRFQQVSELAFEPEQPLAFVDSGQSNLQRAVIGASTV